MMPKADNHFVEFCAHKIKHYGHLDTGMLMAAFRHVGNEMDHERAEEILSGNDKFQKQPDGTWRLTPPPTTEDKMTTGTDTAPAPDAPADAPAPAPAAPEPTPEAPADVPAAQEAPALEAPVEEPAPEGDAA